tara:strand:+ start:129 stop:338 length:210 start_codon:yes stop_codon:yes gene_type:complete
MAVAASNTNSPTPPITGDVSHDTNSGRCTSIPKTDQDGGSCEALPGLRRRNATMNMQASVGLIQSAIEQ